MKRYSTLLLMREIEMKSTLRYHFLPFILAKKSRPEPHCAGEDTMANPFRGNLAISNQLQSICPFMHQSHFLEFTQRHTSTNMKQYINKPVIASLRLIAKYWKQPKYPFMGE